MVIILLKFSCEHLLLFAFVNICICLLLRGQLLLFAFVLKQQASLRLSCRMGMSGGKSPDMPRTPYRTSEGKGKGIFTSSFHQLIAQFLTYYYDIFTPMTITAEKWHKALFYCYFFYCDSIQPLCCVRYPWIQETRGIV